jgi:Plexin repeat
VHLVASQCTHRVSKAQAADREHRPRADLRASPIVNTRLGTKLGAMKRQLKQQLLWLAVCVAAAGCLDPNGDGNVSYDRSGPRGVEQRCGQYTSCGTCTPVLGCGWCSTGDKGLCAAQPNDCAAAMSFDWTWETSGCPAGDAGVASAADASDGVDSSSDAGTSDAASTDAADAHADAASPG